ncbi:TKL protein kinase [Saprolegnia diclina VS20]|uniref:TKL protein kinase n=1 Tax=Saprolegnia diclina (strain VS20) TaxID=1156394 RepID=T0Q4A7_SAPDV|nr:TKL protein kinase [Saprolegnia diclina VS20]EQC28270.1 TKL protein kinase [Saprolegnia diclina VS20]|eukprot:XP_008618274.1 TKL protein kinase [Saprolegnia diclina VS20]
MAAVWTCVATPTFYGLWRRATDGAVQCALDTAAGDCYITPSQAQCEALQSRSLVSKACDASALQNASAPCSLAQAALPLDWNPWTCVSNLATTSTALVKSDATNATVCYSVDHAACVWLPSAADCSALRQTVSATAIGLTCGDAAAPRAMDWCALPATTTPSPADAPGLPASATFWIIVAGVALLAAGVAYGICKWCPKARRPANDSRTVLDSRKTTFFYPAESQFDSSIGDDALLQTVVVRPNVQHLESLTLGAKLELGDLAFWRLDESQLVPLATLSVGTYGTVRVGRYRDQLVAIKTPLTSERTAPIIQAFLDEITLMTRVQSPYVVRVVGISYIRLLDVELVLEYMDKGDLHHHLEVTRSNATLLFPWPQKIACAKDIAKGLLALHTVGIIHRDLKSRNVLFNHAMQAKVSDFGVARNVTTATMTQGVGSYRWTAPEVLEGKRYGVAADVYSFGMILSELDTHHVPYYDLQQPLHSLQDFVLLRDRPATQQLVNVSDGVLMERVMSGGVEPSFSTSCPDAVYNLAIQCIAFDPTTRPKAKAIVRYLRDALRLVG